MQTLTSIQNQPIDDLSHPQDDDPYDASTMSLPQGETEAEPTGLSNRNEAFSSNVGLSKAEDGPFDIEVTSMPNCGPACVDQTSFSFRIQHSQARYVPYQGFECFPTVSLYLRLWHCPWYRIQHTADVYRTM